MMKYIIWFRARCWMIYVEHIIAYYNYTPEHHFISLLTSEDVDVNLNVVG